MALTRLRGFQDLIGADARAVSFVENCARTVAERYSINEIRIPLLERADLYKRSSGETSDVVQKQLYQVLRSAESGGIDDQVLRPEGTPGVIRAYIEAGLDKGDPQQRFFYCGPMFRYERPQKGRYRQFNQFGVEIFGRADAACDAELMIMVDEFRRKLGLEVEFEINSLGDTTCRPAFREALREWGRAHTNQLCEDCRQRLERNPLRLLDCKKNVELVRTAPQSSDYLCEPCREHFSTVQELLSDANVPYLVNPRLVRGLDYYSRTTFEAISKAVGAQSAVVAGGRYDGLVKALGGADVAGIGFAIGVERIALALEKSRFKLEGAPDAVVIVMGDKATVSANVIVRDLRNKDLRTELLPGDRGLKAQLRWADKRGTHYVVIIGENELERGVVQVRDLKTSTQYEVANNEVVAQITTLNEGAKKPEPAKLDIAPETPGRKFWPDDE